MGKRSRDTSFSPSADEAASDTTMSTSIPDESRIAKFAAYDHPVRNQKPVMQCSLPPHSQSIGFPSVDEFEVHYTKEHSNRCTECGKNLPSAHFLNLHLEEIHNPLREALAAKGEKTYACFLPDCEKMCSSPQKRRLHMIDKHSYPKIYNFHVINDGIDNAKTLLQEGRRRRVSVTNDQASLHRQRTANVSKEVSHSQMKVDDGTADARNNGTATEGREVDTETTINRKPISTTSSALNEIDDLETSFAALHFVPRSVIVRRGKIQE